MSNNQTPHTFWELLRTYPVKIPKIQRDYVQGRTLRQVVSAQETLLDDIEAALYNGKPLDLNFIYGKVDDNGDFLPIDGQQRLTTIFLLFVLAINNDPELKSEDVAVLRGFQYATRKSTGDFIDQLLDHTGSFALCNCRIEDSIKDESWFRAEWLADPTVFSMLKVLNKIQDRFDGKADLLERLKGDSITFHYQNTEGIGDEDDLYIKLNARGRLLSDFENLKSEIEEQLSGELKDGFSRKIDGNWRDFFWRLALASASEQRDDISRRFDELSILFFHWYFYCRTLLLRADEEELREKTSYFRLDDYKINVAEAIGDIEVILDHLFDEVSHNRVDSISRWLLDCLCLDGKSISFEAIVKFWAYINRYKLILTDEAAAKWLRIETHLIENSEYNTKNIANAIRSIYRLNDFAEDLMTAFAQGEIPLDLPPINRDIIAEESQKAQLMLSSNDWNDAILSAESELLYCNGQIGFLLDFSKNDIESFKLYHKKAAMIFDAKNGDGVPTEKHDIFRRALLTFGDYSVRGDCFHFNAIVHSLRGGSWRDLLSDTKSGKRDYFKQLLDSITLDGDIIGQLLQMIDRFSLQSDSRYHFIKTDGVMDFMSYGMFKNREPHIRTLLIPNRYVNGRGNAEYRTYALLCILKEKGLCSDENYSFNASSADICLCIPEKGLKVLSRGEYSNLLVFQGDTQIAECATVEEILSRIETAGTK